MKKLARLSLIGILLLTAFLSVPSSQAVLASGGLDFEPGQLVVKLAPMLGGDILGVNQTYGTSTLGSLPNHNNIFLLQAPLGVDVPQLVQVMAADVRLMYAELNYINENPEDGSTDRIYGWGDSAPMQNQDATRTMKLGSAHNLSRGAGTLVAVLDTGVQRQHPALANSLANLGYDFVDNDLAPEDEANNLDDDGDGRVDEMYGHGTHVAGIVHLVAPEALILPLRVLNSDGRGNNFKTATAILYAAASGADAINLSLGTAHASVLLRDTVAEAAQLGVVVVAAAGNLNTNAKQYPAADVCAIATTAVNARDKKSSFANYGLWIGVAAPGESIYSTFPVNGYAWWSGTSMATPFVAGQVALLRSVDSELTLDDIGSLIGGTAFSLDRNNPRYRGLLGEGRIDILASLQRQAAGTWSTGDHNLFSDCNGP